MALLEPYLTNSTIGALTLSAGRIRFGWQNNVSPPDFPAKVTTGDVIGSTDFLGWENPIVTIEGVYDEVSNPKFATLKSFMKATTSVLIYDPVFFTSGTKSIQLQTLNLERSSDNGFNTSGGNTIKGSIINYTLQGVLTE